MIKGIAARNAVRALKRALGERYADSLPTGLEHYGTEHVLVTKWYPEAEVWQLMALLARILKSGGLEGDAWRWLGRGAAANDLEGVYESMVASGRPAITLDRFPKLWRLYRSRGIVTIHHGDEGGAARDSSRAEVRISDHPLLGDRFGSLIGGYMEVMLEKSGATVHAVEVVDGGAETGVAIWRLGWRV